MVYAVLALGRLAKVLGEASPLGGSSVAADFFLFVVKTREVGGRERNKRKLQHDCSQSLAFFCRSNRCFV